MNARKTMCATCPFRKDSPYAGLASYLAQQALKEGRICHSTGVNAVSGNTGKKPLHCRGVRNIQISYMHAAGVIDAPTDEAWTRKWKELEAKL